MVTDWGTWREWTFPICKAEMQDDGSCIVEGIATSEALDNTEPTPEIVDYENAKACMNDWPGNVREMHQLKAVGRSMGWFPSDDTKQIILRTRVSSGEPGTIAKVLDGTLNSYSVAGPPLRRVREAARKADGTEVTANRLFYKRFSEISLVDRGMNPETRFCIVKADGENAGAPAEVPTVDPVQVWACNDLAHRHVYKAEAAKCMAGEAMKVAAREDVNVDDVKHSGPRTITPGQKENKSMKVDIKAVRDAFVAKATALGVKLTPPPDEALKVGFDPEGYCYRGSVQTCQALDALYALACIESVLQSELYEAENDAPEEKEQQAMLQAARENLAKFIASELAENEGELGETGGRPSVSKADEDAEKALSDRAKAHVTKGNAQEMHDHSVKMGAKCGKADKVDEVKFDVIPAQETAPTVPAVPDVPIVPAVPVVPVVPAVPEPAIKAVAPEGDSAKVLADLEAVKAEIGKFRGELGALSGERDALKAELVAVKAKQIVEPGTPIALDAEGNPVPADFVSQKGDETVLTPEETAALVQRANGDPEVVKASISKATHMRLAEKGVRSAVRSVLGR